MSGISRAQYDALMGDLKAGRIAKRKVSGRELSYLEAWDVRAHLIRLFGFGGFSVTADEAECVAHLTEQGTSKRNHVVSWKVRVTLEIGALGATYSEYAIGTANLPDIGEAHDMAIKTAESDALKRAAINLGTQFGLSLYDQGNRADVIRVCLVQPDGEAAPVEMPDIVVTPPAEDAGVVTTPEPDVDSDAWLAELRSYATEPDASKRILAVAALKQRAAGTDYLTMTTDVKGETVTYGRLADLVAAGTWA